MPQLASGAVEGLLDYRVLHASAVHIGFAVDARKSYLGSASIFSSYTVEYPRRHGHRPWNRLYFKIRLCYHRQISISKNLKRQFGLSLLYQHLVGRNSKGFSKSFYNLVLSPINVKT